MKCEGGRPRPGIRKPDDETYPEPGYEPGPEPGYQPGHEPGPEPEHSIALP
jgi:hypothetical protein